MSQKKEDIKETKKKDETKVEEVTKEEIKTEIATPTPQPVTQQPVVEEKNGNAVASLVLGIVALVLFWLPYISITCGIVGIVLSAKGRKIQYRKNMATAGLVLSIISLSLWALFIILFLCAIGLGLAFLGAFGAF